MAEKKYILCVDIKENGILKTIPLATNYLKVLQKYVSYCNNFDELLKTLENTPNGDFSIVERYIRDNSTNELFYKNNVNGKKLNIKVLYKNDIDVVTSTKNDIKEILKKYMIDINEIENVPLDKERVFRLLTERFGTFFKEPSRYRNEHKLDYDNAYSYDERYSKVTSPWQDLGLFEQNIDSFLNEIYKDYRKWQEMCLFLKEIINDKLYDVSKYMGTKKSFDGKNRPISLCNVRTNELEIELQRKYFKGKKYVSTLSRILNDIKENFSFLISKNNNNQSITILEKDISNRPEHINEEILDKELARIDSEYVDEDEYNEPFLGPEYEGDTRYKRY